MGSLGTSLQTSRRELAASLNEPVAIVGIGCRFPGGVSGPSSLWELLSEPRDIAKPVPASRFSAGSFTHPDASHHGTTNNRKAYWLEQDHKVFDAAFFNVSPKEAEAMDPQHRILLETTYEALEDAGIPLHETRGTDTAVFVGQMTADFHDVQMRNVNTLATYAATGGARSITANRLSYFFDWHGPSLTMDTACSSSLLAVHYAVQTLRLGDARVAIAAGCTLNLGPEMFVMESNLSMLSPQGKSRMFDAGADGYGRGEGFSVVILKTLQEALADGDHVYSVIRATGANQDGRTTGIAMPSAEAQARLIRSTYQRAGLDPSSPSDRCQLFEAHGTGTPVGDPLEAEAICKAFFPTQPPRETNARDQAGDIKCHEPPLYCGSIKTVVGHTEGAAGLAGLLKATLAVQRGVIPANLHFETVSPRVKPFVDQGLKVPTTGVAWPSDPKQSASSSACRRASINSFGFGGTNVHAVVENFHNPQAQTLIEEDVLTPIVLSAATNQSLGGLIQVYVDYLTQKSDVPLKQLSWTLQQRRTSFDLRLALTGRTRQSLVAQMSTALKNGVENVASSLVRPEKPRLLGVFTGQGAQWAQMGRKLLRTSTCFAQVISKLQKALDSLPQVSDRPDWTLEGELALGSADSRVNDAEICQPLCTAVQVALVDLLQAAGAEFDVVVGHSSGEIAAAYATGLISASTAIMVAYYRGLVTKKSCNPHDRDVKGAMMAVALGWDEAQELCSDENFAGDVTVAASNSPQSVTLSGDVSKVREIQSLLKDKKISATLLRVDKAYHSRFMEPCASPYLHAMRTSGYGTVNTGEHSLDQSPKTDKRPVWISSVTGRLITADNVPVSLRDGSYWVDNLLRPVRFREAIEAIPTLTEMSIELAVEIGPHPALRRQATQTYQSVARAGNQQLLPYSGSLSRGVDDEESLSNLLGFLWQGGISVDFPGYRNACSRSRDVKCQALRRTPLSGLPSYPWDHTRQYWRESTQSLSFSNRPVSQSDVLGRCIEIGGPGTGTEWRWSNILRLSELPWLRGHQLEHQVVFPAAGYCIIAADAAVQMVQLANESKSDEHDLDWCELRDVTIHRAIQISNDQDMETLVRVYDADTVSDGYKFSISARSAVNGSGDFWLACSGRIVVSGLEKDVDNNGGIVQSKERIMMREATRIEEPVHFRPLDVDVFYAGFAEVGLQYSDAFRLDSIQRTLCRARATISGPSSSFPEEGAHKQQYQGKYLSFPPASLDAAFQTTAAALAFPGDGQMQAPYLPTSIRRLRFDLAACRASQTSPRFVFDAVLSDPALEVGFEDKIARRESLAASQQQSQGLSSSIEGIHEASKQVLFRVDGLGVVPLALPHDPYGEGIFFEEVWAPDITDALFHFEHEDDNLLDSVEYVTAERLALYYMRQVFAKFRSDEAASDNTPWFIRRFYDWLQHRLERVPLEQHHAKISSCPEEILQDVPESARASIKESVLVKLLDAVGQNTVRVMRQEEGLTMLEVLFTNDMLSRMYVEPSTIARANRYLGRVASIISHRFPRCNIFEIGAGTGGATGSMLAGLGGAFKTYTFTDVSAGFFSMAKTKFQDQPGADRMKFKTLDVEKSVTDQGFEEGFYDVVVASNVIHATKDVSVALSNARRLLKPGGYLLLLEVTSSPLIVPFLMGVIPGWWLHDDEYRHGTHSPLMDEKTWDIVLKKTGFSGVDYGFQDMRDAAKHISSVMVAQATDEPWQLFCSGRDIERAVPSHHQPIRSDDSKVFDSTLDLDFSKDVRDLVVVRSVTEKGDQHVSHFLEAVLQCFGKQTEDSGLQFRTHQFSSLEGVARDEVGGLLAKPSTTVLVLSDLDGKPVLQEPVRESEFLAIKSIFENSKNVLWVTQRRHLQQPEHNMIVGLGRCVARESLNLDLQFVDIGDLTDTETTRVVGRILRQRMMLTNGETAPSRAADAWLWSQESELVVERGGKLLLPRLKPIKESNERYLAYRRRILEGQPRQQAGEQERLVTSSGMTCLTSPPPSALFKADRTYFFAGLTGDLALSLAKWMVTNGARSIAMASRRPQIPPVWLDEIHHMQPGVKIQVMQMDVTSKESVRKCCDQISTDMAPIAGIIFGAMVLNDTIFSNMSLPALTTTLAPKVEGARNLDEYFYRTDLDFFIFTSSFSCIVGTRGQSNYSAANMFGRALIAQRRDVRGLAASTVDLSTVFGVGYFAGADVEKQKQVLLNLRGLNAMAVSERDLHAAVYEAMLRGRPACGAQVDLLVGLGTETAFAHRGPPVWHGEPRFSHVTSFGTEDTKRIQRADGSPEEGTEALSVDVGHRLDQVNSAEDKTAVLSSCLGDEIAATMLLDKAHVKPDVPLTDLGVDSLVAVDLRAWFFKELGINVPVLRLLNGDSIRAICKSALLEFNAIR